MSTRVLIIQPYIPEYRVRFLSELRQALAHRGIELFVAAGRPQGALSNRGDSSSLQLDYRLEERTLAIGHKRIHWRQIQEVLRELKPGYVIVEQAIKNLEIYSLLMNQMHGGPRVALWGQGRSYSAKQSKMAALVKQRVTRQSDWFFAYTQSGADHVISRGFPSTRVSVLGNTIDTEELQSHLAGITRADVSAFKREFGLSEGRTGLFLGAVDDVKGIDFLLAASSRIFSELPGYTQLIAGEGVRSKDVESLQRAGWPIRYLGRVSGESKAIALAAADILTIPQWVGLVAVDSIVAARPIVTTNHTSHSPEFDYLIHGTNALVTRHDVNAYAQGVTGLLKDQEYLESLKRGLKISAGHHTLEGMVSSFASGVSSWVASS